MLANNGVNKSMLVEKKLCHLTDASVVLFFLGLRIYWHVYDTQQILCYGTQQVLCYGVASKLIKLHS